jgi:hypothetical protein
MIEVGLVSLLNTSAAITNLVGSRIYPVSLPEDATLPAIAFKLIGSQSWPTFDTIGFQRKRFEFSCYATTYLVAITIKAALISILDRYTGTLSDGSVVSSTTRITGTDLYIQDDMQFCSTVEMYFYFNEPATT